MVKFNLLKTYLDNKVRDVDVHASCISACNVFEQVDRRIRRVASVGRLNSVTRLYPKKHSNLITIGVNIYSRKKFNVNP
jgi:hypothetical protein